MLTKTSLQSILNTFGHTSNDREYYVEVMRLNKSLNYEFFYGANKPKRYKVSKGLFVKEMNEGNIYVVDFGYHEIVGYYAVKDRGKLHYYEYIYEDLEVLDTTIDEMYKKVGSFKPILDMLAL